MKEILLSSAASAAWVLLAAQAAFAVESGAADVSAKAKPEVTTHIAGDYLAGQHARSSGNIDSAIRSLQSVYREDPENMSVAIQLQGMLLLQGRMVEAVKISEEIRKFGAKDTLSSLVLALKHVRDDDFDGANGVLEAVQDAGAAQLWVPLLAGWVNAGRHTIEKPITVDAISTNVGRAAPLIHYHLALIHNQAGLKEEAAKNFKAAIEDPEDPPKRVMKQLLAFYESNGKPEVLSSVVNAYRAAHPETVSDGVLSVASARDGIAEVMYTMGGIMYGAGMANDAAIYLQMATYVKPDFNEAILALGDSYSDLQQYTHANDIYGKVAPGNPYYVNAQMHIALNYERMGKMADGLALLDKLIKQVPGDTDALVTKGDLLRIHMRYGEAVEAYSKALVRVKEPKPSDWPIYFARGTCFERQGKWEDAEKDMLRALELKPDQPDVLNYLGFGWLERGENASEAMAMIKKAIKARPDDAQIVDSMGWAYYVQGDYKAAMQYLERAVELLPGDPTVNDHLGDLYWRLGRKTEARFQWERSLTFSPEERLSQIIQRKLKDGLPPSTAAARTLTTSDARDKPSLNPTP